MKQVLMITGPTASGKSAFAIACAHRFGGSIISGDSIQIYRGFDIGSGKIRKEEMEGIRHDLLDLRDPQEAYSVSDFQKEARACVRRLSNLPIVVGGTGLYLKAFLYDYVFPKQEAAIDPSLERLSNETLYARLCQADPEQAKKIHPHNRRRLLRSLSILQMTGCRQSVLISAQQHHPVYDAFIVGCTMERALLYERINQRVEKMFADGLVQEVEGLLASGVTFQDPAMQGIGYREFASYFKGEKSLADVKAEIQLHSRRYAKKQYTWLRHQMKVHWFDAGDEKEKEKIMMAIAQWRKT